MLSFSSDFHSQPTDMPVYGENFGKGCNSKQLEFVAGDFFNFSDLFR